MFRCLFLPLWSHSGWRVLAWNSTRTGLLALDVLFRGALWTVGPPSVVLLHLPYPSDQRPAWWVVRFGRGGARIYSSTGATNIVNERCAAAGCSQGVHDV